MIVRDDRLNLKDVIDSMREIRYVKQKLSNAADNIFPNSSKFLDDYFLRRIITAEISDAEVATELVRQKAFFHRLCNLLPCIGRIVRMSDDNKIRSFLMIINDCFHDYPFVLKAPRGDKIRRNTIDKLNKIIDIIAKLDELLCKDDQLIKLEFENIISLTKSFIINSTNNRLRFEDFERLLKTLTNSAELTRYKIMNGELDVSNYNNQRKTYIVAFSYDLSLLFDNPPLKTTPGSDFSSLCSLLHELITGERDESLSGAINRFSRSPERQKKDVEESELRTENDLDDDVDNFYIQKKQFKQSTAAIEQLSQIVLDKSVSEQLRGVILEMMESYLERAKDCMKCYGPHIVWAHQAPARFIQKHESSETLEDQLLAKQIEIGNVRRRIDRAN